MEVVIGGDSSVVGVCGPDAMLAKTSSPQHPTGAGVANLGVAFTNLVTI